MAAVKGGDGGACKVEDDEKRGLRQRRWVKKRTGRALEANHMTASKEFSIQTVTCVAAYSFAVDVGLGSRQSQHLTHTSNVRPSAVLRLSDAKRRKRRFWLRSSHCRQ
jgi:hypothetical protein